jgi:hypothetical protein
MDKREELRSAICELYDVFGRYPRPSVIDYCPCGCTKPEEVAPLLAVPLLDLPFHSLGNYTFSAMTTQGSVDDFKYFLPRILEGIAQESYCYNPEILFGKLRYGKWLTWNESEITVVRRYLRALWRTGVCAFPLEETLPAFFDIETLLASLATTGGRLEPYLEIWDETNVMESEQHLIRFVTMYGSDLSNGKVLNFGFWEDLPEQAEEIRRWILKPETLERINRSKHLLLKDEDEHLFGPALEILRVESEAMNQRS